MTIYCHQQHTILYLLVITYYLCFLFYFIIFIITIIHSSIDKILYLIEAFYKLKYE